MKFKSRTIFIMLLSIATVYTACKKSKAPTPVPTNPVIPAQTIAGHVAVNANQSLFGGLTSFNLSGGLSAPTTYEVKSKGKILQSTTTPTCSLIVDTTLSYSFAAAGTELTITGIKNATFTCTNDTLSGYNTINNLVTLVSNADSTVTYKVAENYTVNSLNYSNPLSNLSLSGSLTSNETYQYLTGTKATGTSTFTYGITSVVITPTGSAAVSGSANFTSTGSGPQGVWNYQGTITFLGNNMATVTISGTTYTVNLLTGATN